MVFTPGYSLGALGRRREDRGPLYLSSIRTRTVVRRLDRTLEELAKSYHVKPSPLLRILRAVGWLVPGDWLKTFFYLNCIAAPRQMMRRALFAFYRYDHVYAVLGGFRSVPGQFSVLEFGTSAGYSFVKLLYATRYLGLADRVTVHGFDSFEGLPPTSDPRDADLTGNDQWIVGQYRGDYDRLQAYCRARYQNFALHRGRFESSLTDQFLETLRAQQPVLVWIDADYYTSARTVLERLLPWLPSGCVVYFDELDTTNFGSRLTGEARLVHEINHGQLGEGLELVVDPELSLNSNRVYRFVRLGTGPQYRAMPDDNAANLVRVPTNGSPLP